MSITSALPAELAPAGTKRHRRADPRTKLLLLFLLDALAITPGPETVGWSIAAVCVIALTALGHWRRGLVIGVGYVALQLAATGAQLTQTAPGAAVSVAFLLCARYFLPVMVAMVLLSTTRVSELIAALRALRIPETVIIPLAVVFRFVPTVIAESRSILAALALRRAEWRLGWLRRIEYLLVPLVASVLRIGDELTASALTRGLGGSRRPTSIARIGFGPADLCWLLGGSVPLVLFVSGLR